MNQASPAPAKFPTLEAAIAAVRANRNPNGSQAELAAAEAAAAFAPDRADVWIMVASAATRLGEFDRAEAAQLKALEVETDPLMKDRLEVDRAWTLAGQRRWAEAAALARKDRPRLANDPISRNILGATLVSVGKGAEALPHLELAARGLPDRPDIAHNLAVVYNSLGRTDEAEATVRAVIRTSPGYLHAYEFLGELRRATPDSNLVERLTEIRRRVPVRGETAFIDYTLFRQLDDLGRREEAWTALMRAAGAKAAERKWSVAEDEATVTAFESLAAGLPKTPAPTAARPRPIFIVSLPRTGSTLVERIFSAHPKVTALGELETFSRAAKAEAELGPWPYVDARLADADPIDWTAVGARYREEVAGLSDGAEVVTDKMPLNWWYAPMIAAALPDAVIVHIRREPMDALFGALKVNFADAFGWAYRQEDLAAHYAIYRRLSARWAQMIGDRLVEIDYEALVSDPQAQTRRLLAACGLDFDPACLKPEKAEGSVITPSAAQVREPITSGRVGAWRRYAEQLEPLRARLQADGWVDADGNGIA